MQPLLDGGCTFKKGVKMKGDLRTLFDNWFSLNFSNEEKYKSIMFLAFIAGYNEGKLATMQTKETEGGEDVR